jgi:hypothetical protein
VCRGCRPRVAGEGSPTCCVFPSFVARGSLWLFVGRFVRCVSAILSFVLPGLWRICRWNECVSLLFTFDCSRFCGLHASSRSFVCVLASSPVGAAWRLRFQVVRFAGACLLSRCSAVGSAAARAASAHRRPVSRRSTVRSAWSAALLFVWIFSFRLFCSRRVASFWRFPSLRDAFKLFAVARRA